MAGKRKRLTKSKDRISFEEYLKKNGMYPTPAQKKRLWQNYRSKKAVERMRGDRLLVSKLSKYDINDMAGIIRTNSASKAVLKIRAKFPRLLNVDIAKIMGIGERRIYEIFDDMSRKEGKKWRLALSLQRYNKEINSDSSLNTKPSHTEEKSGGYDLACISMKQKKTNPTPKKTLVKKYRCLTPEEIAIRSYELLKCRLDFIGHLFKPEEKTGDNPEFMKLFDSAFAEFWQNNPSKEVIWTYVRD